MDLLQNPFYILNATPRDNRRRIVELSEERSLLLNSSDCAQAYSDLTNPRKRLSAEIAWLPGFSPKNSEMVIAWLSKPVQTIPSSSKLNSLLFPLVRANILASGIQRLVKHNVGNVTKWILELAWAFENIDSEKLCSVINEERIVSGFPEVTELSIVETEIQERRRYYSKAMKSALDNLPPKELVEAVTIAVESATENGEEQAPLLIDDLVDSYEVEAQAFLEKEAENIETLIEKIRQNVEVKRSDSILERMITQLCQVVRNWDTVAQPIQVSAKSRGLNHAASNHIAHSIRNLAIHLFNEFDKLEFSQTLTNLLQETFAEVDEIAEITAGDASTLEDIAEERVKMLNQATQRAEQWRKEITYEVEVGRIFKDRLKISPDGVEWKGRHMSLDSITRTRWGATRHYVNGIPSGTTYSIVVGNTGNSYTIDPKKENVYNQFVDRLWKAIGVRILTELLEGLREGKRYRFGSATINDHGMELEKVKWIGDNEHIFCPWNELVIWNEPGSFCIGKKTENKLKVNLSYQNDDNIHILEAAIRTFWKRATDKISDLLED